MIRLLDSEPDRDNVSEFLGRYLHRLPWPFIEALLARLDTEPGGKTAQILAHSRDPRVTSRLIRLLDEESGQLEDVFVALRDQAAECFVEEMNARFDNPQQRYRAAQVLKTYSVPGVAEKMLQYIGGSDPAARLHALQVLSDHHDARVFEALCKLSADNDPTIRHSAAQGLVFRADPAAVEVLRPRMDDPDPLVRLWAASGVILASSAKLAEILEFARNPTAYARFCAANALAAHSGSHAATLALIDLAADPEPSVRYSAAKALASHFGDDAATALIGLLDDQHCMLAASQSLHSYDTPTVTNLLGRWLAVDPSEDRLTAAVRAAAGMSAPEATDLLLNAVTHENDIVREASASALAGRDNRAVTTALAKCLADDSPMVRKAAATALQSASDNPQLISALLARLSDSDCEVRAAAAGALHISDRYPEVTPALIGLLTGECTDARIAAASKLGSAATPAALLSLCDLADFSADTELAVPRDTVEQLAERVYRMLPPDERPRVLRSLAKCKFAAAAPSGSWSLAGEPNIRFSPDMVSDEHLDTEVVILLRGTNLLGNQVYIYLQIIGRDLKRIFAEMQADRNFKPSHYGSVLFAGVGVPPPEVRKVMTDKYDMIDIP
jgi:HEAT repeat protein